MAPNDGEGPRPGRELEMDVLGIVGNDYESLKTIREDHWGDDDPLPAVSEMLGVLRELQRKGWVQCYRLVPGASGFTPIDDFPDDAETDPKELTGEAKLWWLATKSGLEELLRDQ